MQDGDDDFVYPAPGAKLCEASSYDADKLDDVPLFATRVPGEGGSGEQLNPSFEAIQSLVYEGTPDEIAENLRSQGNECFRKGEKHMQDALEYYTRALEQKAAKPATLCACLVNRAAVNLKKGNLGRVIEDCREALKMDPTISKAYWRSAQALSRLGRHGEAVQTCRQGIEKCGEQQQEQSELRSLLAKCEGEVKRAQEQAKRREAEEKAVRASSWADAAAITELEKRKVRVDLSAGLDTSPWGDVRVTVDHDGVLRFPVILSFGEASVNELSASVREDQPLGEVLEEVLSETKPWDDRGLYTPSRVEMYVDLTPQTGSSAPIARVNPARTLSNLLSNPRYVLPKFPVIQFVALDTPYRSHFLSQFKQ